MREYAFSRVIGHITGIVTSLPDIDILPVSVIHVFNSYAETLDPLTLRIGTIKATWEVLSFLTYG
jgi:hypothetical protein